ncbi:ankyrin repeat domain-containing protein [Stenotrophomonas sp. CFBP8980]|uniref:ankyrin repeat domain-containing protein n=1 Tax=Stenotrophomonas sp. CFBP8980 TaxID=3096523 RepID=UPI002A6A4917|nr:ankyrin repeat domain-containing protein [Stenotrophomonas sp. CFBP8980]MDY1032777.1 ankyrin repeat domain-containing protein [Stenotrophomonas sp. CFBP8980]
MNAPIRSAFGCLVALCTLTAWGKPNVDTKELPAFRYSLEQMQQISNPHLLAHRNFYDTPSTGPDAAWFDAVKRGNLAEVRRRVEAGQDLEAKDEASLGQTALGWAAFIGYLDIVQFLVEHGADIRATDRADVYNALKSAVMGPNAEVVKYLHGLLRDETDWDARESDQETLFMVAAVDGRLETVKYILQFDPDLDVVAINESPKINESPLSGACEGGFTDVADLLIAKGAINHKTGRSSCD